MPFALKHSRKAECRWLQGPGWPEIIMENPGQHQGDCYDDTSLRAACACSRRPSSRATQTSRYTCSKLSRRLSRTANGAELPLDHTKWSVPALSLSAVGAKVLQLQTNLEYN